MRQFFLITLLLLTACGKPPVHTQESFVFGTRVEVLVADPETVRAGKAAAAVLQEFDRLHRTYHAWKPSELTALNEAIAKGTPSPVSVELAQFIIDAQHLSAEGQHLFDPGIGRLISLWGFQSDEFTPQLPSAEALASWRQSAPSIAGIQINGEIVGSTNKDIALDFGGYLKGVALDRAATLLREQGVTNALINIGGNVMALGTKHGEPWRIGIQHPRQPGTLATLMLEDGEAVGTSGDYQRFFELDKKRYCHLLDPRSAAPVEHTQAVTVLISPRAQAGMLSDAASKPLFIAGPTDWRGLAADLKVEALRVGSDGSIEVSRAFASRLKFNPDVSKPSIIDLPPR